MKNKTVYLGDALYAEYDGHQVILKANDPIHPTDTVYLEEEVLQNLITFYEESKDER